MYNSTSIPIFAKVNQNFWENEEKCTIVQESQFCFSQHTFYEYEGKCTIVQESQFLFQSIFNF